MASAILSAKPIKTWYEVVVVVVVVVVVEEEEEEEEEKEKEKLQNNLKYKQTKSNIGFIRFQNHQNYFWHYKKSLNRPPVTKSHKQLVFLKPFQNHKQGFLLKNPYLPYKVNKHIFLNQNPNIFLKLTSKRF